MNPKDLIPYDNNARIHNIDAIANSIKQFGFKEVVSVDENNVIINGHGRVKASIKLGLEKIPVAIVTDLTEEEKKALRLADNKVAELTEWDEEKFKSELQAIEEIDMADFGIAVEEEREDNIYTKKIPSPNYEVKGDCPNVESLVDCGKYNKLLLSIEKSEIPSEIKTFLKLGATRHIIFDYGKIAEFYAHQNKDVQALIEDSAMVIIDFQKAIEDGYVRLGEYLDELKDEEL